MSFDSKELKRLSEAATPGPWVSNGHTVWARDGEIRWREASALMAYLGTHRDRIIAMLEAADALAEADHALCNVLHFAAIPGAAEVAPIEYVLTRADEARDAYKKAKGA